MRAQYIDDYYGSWNQPTISQSTNNFKSVFFGMVGLRHREPGIDLTSLPPIPGLKYRSYSSFCPKDTCYATRAVIAVRYPKDSVLLGWASKRAALFAGWCINRNYPKDVSDNSKISSSADICNKYIRIIRRSIDRQNCGEDSDHDVPNEQFAFLLTDCWRVDSYHTFYEASWYDWMSCGDNTKESYFTVNNKTGEVASILDFVQEKDLLRLAKIMMKHLKNYKGEPWVYPDFEWVATEPLELLKQMNGCALIREGLVIYYHPYEIGCGTDGHFKAVIPYDELKGMLLIDMSTES